jgi:hypothetical protein
MKLALLAGAVVLLAACTRLTGPETTTTTIPTTTTALPAETTTPSTPGIEELPPAAAAQLEELIGVTEELRGLEFDEQPVVRVVTPDELAVLVTEMLAEDLDNADVDEGLYRLLGLIDGDTDLLQLYQSVLGEQVAGFYDADIAELVVPLRQGEFSLLEQSTIVHELTHALTDQGFGFGGTYRRLIDEERFDEASAYQAVIEGDAVFTELAYLRGLSPDEQREVIEESLSADTAALDAAPRFLRESLVFPYVEGQLFVERLYGLGGLEAVNEAYTAPPVSTEQIFSPQDYQRDEPVDLEMTAPDLPGYSIEYESVWGELGFELMFNQHLGGRSEAANGWGADRYVVYHDGSELALALVYRGDVPEDAIEMEDALVDYSVEAMAVGEPAESEGGTVAEGDDYVLVSRHDELVTWVAASDPAVGAALVDALLGD